MQQGSILIDQTALDLYQSLMDRDQSYFARTNWFIWIGFTSSIVMILLVGFSLAPEWVGQKQVISPRADHIVDAIIVLTLIWSFWLQIKIKKALLNPLPNQLGQEGRLSLLYTLFLFSNEVFVGIGFYYGFILKDTERFYWYGLASLLCNFLTLPNITLKKPKLPAPTKITTSQAEPYKNHQNH